MPSITVDSSLDADLLTLAKRYYTSKPKMIRLMVDFFEEYTNRKGAVEITKLLASIRKKKEMK